MTTEKSKVRKKNSPWFYIKLFAEKEFTDTFSRKSVLVILSGIAIYLGIITIATLDFFSNISFQARINPQSAGGSDPNQGVLAPLFNNSFILFLIIFPLLAAAAVVREREQGTYDIVSLSGGERNLLAGKVIFYWLFGMLIILMPFLNLLPFFATGGFIDGLYAVNLLIHASTLALVWTLLFLFISRVSPNSSSAIYIAGGITVALLSLSFLESIITSYRGWLIFKSIIEITPLGLFNHALEGTLKPATLLLWLTAAFFTGSLLKGKRESALASLIVGITFTVLVSRVMLPEYDLTFNKANSLSKRTTALLDNLLLKSKEDYGREKVYVFSIISYQGPKWETAQELIELFKRRYRRIKFVLVEPEERDLELQNFKNLPPELIQKIENAEYGKVIFYSPSKPQNSKSQNSKYSIDETLSIDENVFARKIYRVITGKEIKAPLQESKPESKPYDLSGLRRTIVILWEILFPALLVASLVFLKNRIQKTREVVP